MKRRSLLQAGLLAPLVARAQTPCPAELTAIDGDPVPPGAECVSTGGWPAHRPSYLPVVPNLAGYGCDTLAGYGVSRRGDNVQVLYVTTLANSGTGSLQEVLNRDIGGAARVIVFNVEGYINVDWLIIEEMRPHVTIAGQTAPGKGILVRGGPVTIEASHVLMQHIHVRPGDASIAGSVGWQSRKFEAYNYKQNPASSRVIMDHCSISWCGDEGYSAYSLSTDCTLSHSIVMQTLSPDQGGAKNVNISGGSSGNPNRVSVFGCLMGHSNQRAPLIRCPAVTFCNNVIYNWGQICSDMQSYDNRQDLDLVTAIGNYYKAGPNTGSTRPWRIRGDGDTYGCNVNSKLYLQDNRWNGTVTSPQSNMVTFGSGRSASQNYLTGSSAYPAWHNGIVPAASADAYDLVLRGVGAFSANRDSVDARFISDVTNGTSSGWSPSSVPLPWPTYGSTTRDHRTQHNYRSGTDPIPDGQSGRPAPGTINPSTGRTLIEEWCQRRAAEVEAV